MELKINHITKKYDKNIALNDISLNLQEGIYGLLGPNGAGKSTLFKILTQLITYDGEIILDGKNVKEYKESYRHLLGYMPQQQAFYEHFKAYDYLAYLSQVKGMKKDVAKERIIFLLEEMELIDCAWDKIKTFSGGMKQRLLLCAALLNDPKILLLDEPTAGLDPRQRIHVRNLIAKISLNKIVIIATHVVSDVEMIANEFIFLKEGKVIQKGNLNMLQSQLKNMVKEMKVSEEVYHQMKETTLISNVFKVEHQLLIRMIDVHQQYSKASIVDPTLEDVYLYYYRL